MDIATFVKDWGSLIISIFGILGSLWVYFHHEHMLKCQEKRLNELQISQFEKENAKDKMAEIKANVIHREKGNARIRFVNAGKSNACNVKLEILTPEEDLSGVICDKQWGPYAMINPQSYREERIALCIGHPSTIMVKVHWDDDYKKNRCVELSIPL